MVRITRELLKKRSEHNEGILSTLKEITLHQFEIEKIELVGTLCKDLEILYLQHNLIEKIENLSSLKSLKYLNLALNSIRKIENLERNEKLAKLDLTINYIDDLMSVENLKGNYSLKELFLVGNPCQNFPQYRMFVIATLPQLQKLDGADITKSERIISLQEFPKIKKDLQEYQKNMIERNNEKMRNVKPTFNEKGERLYGNDPVSRKMAAKELQAKRKDKEDRSVDTKNLNEYGKKNERRRLTAAEELERYGKIMQKNEGKWKFKFFDEDDKYILDVPVGKFCLTTQIAIDLQPKYVVVTVRGKRLCLRFEKEVKTGSVQAQRSRATGNLKITVEIDKTSIDYK